MYYVHRQGFILHSRKANQHWQIYCWLLMMWLNVFYHILCHVHCSPVPVMWISCQLQIAPSYKSHTHNHFMALWILSWTTRVSQYQKKHSPTHTYPGHQLSLICFIHLLRSMASSLFNTRAWQSFSTICVQVFFGLPLAWHPPLHTPYISSPNHCLLFATHAHTIAVCFAVVPRLCHVILVSLSTLYLEFCLVVLRQTSI